MFSFVFDIMSYVTTQHAAARRGAPGMNTLCRNLAGQKRRYFSDLPSEDAESSLMQNRTIPF